MISPYIESAVSHVASVGSVASLSVIMALVLGLYFLIRAKTWLWFLGAWGFAWAVRVWIMLCDLWPEAFPTNITLLNALMGLVYVGLGFGVLGLYLALREALKRSPPK